MIGMGIRTLVSGDGIETKSVSITAWFTQEVLKGWRLRMVDGFSSERSSVTMFKARRKKNGKT